MCDMKVSLADPRVQKMLLGSVGLAMKRECKDIPQFVYSSLVSQTPVQTSALDRYACFFTANALPLLKDVPPAVDAMVAAENLLLHVSLNMWKRSGEFTVFMVMKDRPVDEAQLSKCRVPTRLDLLLKVCANFAGFRVDVKKREILAPLGQVLFVFLTNDNRMHIDAPALIVRSLRVHGFPDAKVAGRMKPPAHLQ
jgi:hypothetical protein